MLAQRQMKRFVIIALLVTFLLTAIWRRRLYEWKGYRDPFLCIQNVYHAKNNNPENNRNIVYLIDTGGEDLQHAMDSIPYVDSPNMPRALNQSQMAKAMALLDRLSNFFQDHNITWTMYFGTLLGSYMCHSMLPWDDDIDIMVDVKHIAKIIQLHHLGVLQREQNIGLYVHCRGKKRLWNLSKTEDVKKCKTLKLKFYDGVTITRAYHNYPWNWPFVDADALHHNSTFAWNQNDDVIHDYFINIDDFLPFHLCPFGQLWLPAPNHPKQAMAKHFTLPNNHKTYGATFACLSSF